MSELETRRAAAAAGEPHPDLVRTAELIQYEDAELDAAELEAADLGTLDADGADAADADLLAIPPRADDLGTALAARPPRLKLPKITLALAGAALICAGFVGGVLVQKHLGGSSSSGRGNFAAAFTGGRTGTGTTGRTGTGTGAGTGGFFGRGGTGAAGGGAITGTVTVVSGNKLYVTAADGSVYTVTTSGSTVINVTKSGALSQLKPGQTVVIAGTNDNSGDVTATSITASSSSSTSGTNTTGGQ
ncbi:hypothetical protein [Actinocrinis sp.]|uniref:hypothetical protein n=1 Tax=Actinocrinis sp. TaxID=1920516 RepID=UPI002CB44803|nr:hypothetical protein [Actinocrinis sp.]HXR69877.1 hypothetical protein [Actinocrinis sp.]